MVESDGVPIPSEEASHARSNAAHDYFVLVALMQQRMLKQLAADQDWPKQNGE